MSINDNKRESIHKIMSVLECGLNESKQCFLQLEILEKVENANSMEDLKGVLKDIINRVYPLDENEVCKLKNSMSHD